jgi:molybdopterin converting factor subunit 1
MEVNILAFGIAKEITGAPSFKMQLSDKATVAELKKELENRWVELARLSSFLLAVNDEYSEEEDLIKPGDEIAIIPPVSGG